MNNANTLPGYINTETTSATIGVTTVTVEPILWFDSSYLRTTPGLLKIAAIIIDLFTIISVSSGSCSSSCGSVTSFNMIAILAFWISLSLLILYLFHVIEKIDSLNWALVEFIYTGICCILFFVLSILILTNGSVNVIASIFGVIAGAVYAFDAFLKYHVYQSGELTQRPSAASTSPNSNSFP